MDFLFPVAHIVCESTAKTVDKLNFRDNRIAPMHLMRLVFVGMTITLGLYIILTNQSLPAMTPSTVGVVLLMVLVSFVANVFDFLSLKENDLSLREPMLGFKPIMAGMIGFLLFPQERKVSLLVALGLSTLVVYFGTHRRKLRINEKKGMLYLLLAVLLYAVLPTIYKLALEQVSPEYLSFFRTAGILLLSSLFLPIRKQTRSRKKWAYGLLSGIIYAAGTVTSLYTIDRFGVAQTMLLFMLAPTLIYLSGYFVLREKVRTGEVISSFLLVAIVLFTFIL